MSEQRDPLSSTDGAGRLRDRVVKAMQDEMRHDGVYTTSSHTLPYVLLAEAALGALEGELAERERTRVLEEALNNRAEQIDPWEARALLRKLGGLTDYDRRAVKRGTLKLVALAAVAVEDGPTEVEASGPSSNETADSVDETRSARPVPAGETLSAEETLEHAAALAERYGEAILRIREALHDEQVNDRARITKAQLVIAGLAPKAAGTLAAKPPITRRKAPNEQR